LDVISLDRIFNKSVCLSVCLSTKGFKRKSTQAVSIKVGRDMVCGRSSKVGTRMAAGMGLHSACQHDCTFEKLLQHTHNYYFRCVCGRAADKKAAIGYTYEDSSAGAGGSGLDNLDDDDASSDDEDIDLGKAAVLLCLPTANTVQLYILSRCLDSKFFKVWQLKEVVLLELVGRLVTQVFITLPQ